MSTMTRLIKTLMFTPGPKGWGLPALFWGSPGVAKTDVIESVALEYGMLCETLSPGERGEAAFGVVPVPMKKKDGRMVLTQPPPDFLDVFEEDGRGLLFVDEMTTAPLAVMPALLGLVQSRRLGSAYLGQGVRVLAAANPIGSAANGRELSKANANRMAHIDWDAPDASQWTEWLVGHDAKAMRLKVDEVKSAEQEEKRVLALWDNAHAGTKGLIAGFIRKRPELLHMEPDDSDPQAGRSWSSRRTWDLASRAITGAKLHGLNEVEEQLLIASFVGDGSAVELFKYRKESDLPDPVEVLDGKVVWSPDGERLDKVMAVFSSCVALVMSPTCGHKDARVEMLYKLLGKLGDDAKDIALVAGTPLIQKEIGTNTPTAIKVLAKLAPIVQAGRK